MKVTRPSQIVCIILLILMVSCLNVQRLTEPGILFHTSDTLLQKMYDRAEALALENIVDYGGREVLIEGAQYRSVWLETQPMGGYMYAKRNTVVAKNNIEIFFDYQRDDGRLPGVIYNRTGTPEPNYCQFQGLFLARPAYELYFLLGHDTAFLRKVYYGLEKFDNYLWKTRDSDHNGCLETWCIYDTGEDHCVRFNEFPNAWFFDFPPSREAAMKMTPEELKLFAKEDSYDNTVAMTVPIESMDVMSYSYSCRDVLSLISSELGNGKVEFWRNKAEEVKNTLLNYLWDEEEKACYDRDCNNMIMPVMLHNNLRCMYFGSFSQDMADSFVKHHLMNPDEFWTPMPLPSIAANDPLFRNIPGNNWSGQPQGLTYQRSIQALENYGHYAELTLIGKKFLEVTCKSRKFTQQFDPFTAMPGETKDGYGPSILAALEFISRFYGIHVTRDRIYWSCLDNNQDYSYAQLWNGMLLEMKTVKNKVICSIDGKRVLSFSRGARIVTDTKGHINEVVGIETENKDITVAAGKKYKLTVEPNTVYRPDGNELVLLRSVEFCKPGKSSASLQANDK